MQAIVDAVWERLGPLGVSWVGFYVPVEGGNELILGPRRDKPACSPIGLHGVCGRAFVERRSIVVEDVRALGESYIACDPADRSEVVVPVVGSDGAPWAVLDLDSHEAGFFTQDDVTGLEKVLASAFPAA
jgi:putative methionine-R-sulfoxide reductase with GAF domain